MTSRRVGVWSALVIAIAGGLWWWQHHAPVPVANSATRAPSASVARVEPARGPASEPARIRVTVSDDHGPLSRAFVRLSPVDGEIVATQTGADGVARAEGLAPGAWRVSAAAADHLPETLPIVQLAGGHEAVLAIQLSSGGRTLRGTVSDTTGGPIAGARIDAVPLAPAGPRGAVATTLTAVDGTYAMTVAPGMTLVAAASADYATQRRNVEVVAAGAVADFALIPGGAIEGVVRDEQTHEPVAGARVVVERDHATWLFGEASARPVTAGADGRFRIGGLRPGAWALSAADHGRFSKAPAIVGLGVAEQVSDVEILISVGPVIRGRVIDDAGAPVAGAGIRARLTDAFAATQRDASADAEGAFVIEGLRPGKYEVSANSPSHVSTGGHPVTLLDRDVDVVIPVKRAAMITGHVAPRQRCDVQQVSDPRTGVIPNLPGASTGADGAFSIGPARDGATRLTARCASGDQGVVAVTVARGMAEVVLAVTPGASIAGHVIDGDGKPVAGAGVVASEAAEMEVTTMRDGAVTSGVQAVTDATGAYQLDGLTPGSYRLRALERGKPMHPRAAPPLVVLGANQQKTGVDLAVDRPAGVLSGVVTAPDGSPVADAWISVHQDMLASLQLDSEHGPRAISFEDGNPDGDAPPALTDAHGHYEIRGLPDAIYDVVAEAQHGRLRGKASHVRPSATVNLAVQGVVALTGTVTGGAAGALLSVELEGPTRAQRGFTGQAFSFDRLDPGAYTVRVAAGSLAGEGKIEIVAGQPATISIALAAAPRVVGTLVDPAGKPIAGAEVILVPERADGMLEFRSDGPPPVTGADGRFTLEHRPEHCALVITLTAGGQHTRRGLVLEGGKTLDLGTIVIKPGAP